MNIYDLRAALRPTKRRAQALFHEMLPSSTHLMPNDIFLASFPKSGNTFFRFIWANIELGLAGDTRIIHFPELETSFGTDYESRLSGSYTFKNIPRLVKTHYPQTQVPLGNRKVVFVIRNPGDVMVSYHKYLPSRGNARFQNIPIGDFIRNREFGMSAWIRHTRSWINSDVVKVHYEDMKDTPNKTVKEVFEKLGLPVPTGQIIENAVERSSFDNIRKLEEKYGHAKNVKKFEGGTRFTRTGKSDQWRQEFSASDIEFVNRELEKAGLSQFQLKL